MLSAYTISPRFVMAVLCIGILSGVLGVVFHQFVVLATALFYGTTSAGNFTDTLAALPIWWKVAAPTIGGLLVGLIVVYTKTPEVAGEGIPAVMNALEHPDRVIRARVAPLKALVSAITLGSGGSAGREGPVIQIGAALGALSARIVKVSPIQTETLLLAGAAATMAATFGTPVAAIVFVGEVLRRSVSLQALLVIFLAVGVAILVSQFGFGYPGLQISVPMDMSWGTPFSLLSMIGLGVLAGLTAGIFGWLLRIIKKAFSTLLIPTVLKPAIGGMVVGILCLFVPFLQEPATYPLLTDLISGATFSAGFLVLVLMAKLLATTVTIGSGGSGGIFAPSLLLGCLLGAVYSAVMSSVGGLSESVLYMVVGMAAVFAAAAHAPITAIFMLYEMTDVIATVPSLICGCVAAYVVMHLTNTKSVYHSE